MIEYFYALASPWSYLGNDRLRQIAQRYELSIDPFVIDYDRMFEAAGTVPLPQRPPLRKRYRLVELERWSRMRQVPLNPQPRFYQGEVEEPDEHMAALLVTAAKLEGLDSLELAHAIQRALWAQERSPFDNPELQAIVAAEGFDWSRLQARVSNGDAEQAYQQTTQLAIDRDVFGMPFYVFDDEPFWGQDRLELLEAAIQAKA